MFDREASGWAVFHDRSALPPSEYETFYLFGPLPTKEMADLIEANTECDCRKMVVPVFFPHGVTMHLEGGFLPLGIVVPPTDGPVH